MALGPNETNFKSRSRTSSYQQWVLQALRRGGLRNGDFTQLRCQSDHILRQHQQQYGLQHSSIRHIRRAQLTLEPLNIMFIYFTITMHYTYENQAYITKDFAIFAITISAKRPVYKRRELCGWLCIHASIAKANLHVANEFGRRTRTDGKAHHFSVRGW